MSEDNGKGKYVPTPKNFALEVGDQIECEGLWDRHGRRHPDGIYYVYRITKYIILAPLGFVQGDELVHMPTKFARQVNSYNDEIIEALLEEARQKKKLEELQLVEESGDRNELED